MCSQKSRRCNPILGNDGKKYQNNCRLA
ncbi:hypothetical protein [Vibrio navarrensis]